jgi:hypothetical protein
MEAAEQVRVGMVKCCPNFLAWIFCLLRFACEPWRRLRLRLLRIKKGYGECDIGQQHMTQRVSCHEVALSVEWHGTAAATHAIGAANAISARAGEAKSCRGGGKWVRGLSGRDGARGA